MSTTVFDHVPQLSGTHVRLEPLATVHAAGLAAAAADGELWTLAFTSVPAPGREAAYIANALDEREREVEVLEESRLAEQLARTDVLIMILPSTPQTRGALDAEALAALPAHAWVINVGRGDAVDEPALLHALNSGGIAPLVILRGEDGEATQAFANGPGRRVIRGGILRLRGSDGRTTIGRFVVRNSRLRLGPRFQIGEVVAAGQEA